jgi:hypothetical protein
MLRERSGSVNDASRSEPYGIWQSKRAVRDTATQDADLRVTYSEGVPDDVLADVSNCSRLGRRNLGRSGVSGNISKDKV